MAEAHLLPRKNDLNYINNAINNVFYVTSLRFEGTPRSLYSNLGKNETEYVYKTTGCVICVIAHIGPQNRIIGFEE